MGTTNTKGYSLFSPDRSLQLDNAMSLSADSASSSQSFSSWLDQNAQYGGVVAGAAQAVGGAFSSYYANSVQKIRLQMQKELADYNSRQAERAAQSALMVSNFRIGVLSEKYEKTKSSQKAAMAANGIMLGVGSAAEVTTTTDIDKHRSMEEERLNGQRQARGLRTQSLSYSLTANSLAHSGAATSWGGSVDAFATGVGTAANEYLYTKYKFKDKGI